MFRSTGKIGRPIKISFPMKRFTATNEMGFVRLNLTTNSTGGNV